MEIEIKQVDFVSMLTVLKSMTGLDKKDRVEFKQIKLVIGQGLICGYSSNGVGAAKYRIRTNYIGEPWEITIGIPQIMPKTGEDVLVSIDKDIAAIRFGNVVFEYKQYEDSENRIELDNLFEQVDSLYRKQKESEDVVTKNRINRVYANEKYLYRVMTALHKIKETKVSIEVDDINTRAIRITAKHENIEIYVLPMLPDRY